jgi:acetoin:2,6-dichlorophenolindophenol oxidoreductase subunit beta
LPTKNVIQAIQEATQLEMARDPRTLLIGQSVQGSLFGTGSGLVTEFGPERVIDTPLAESTAAGAAIGLALTGYRPILEHIASFSMASFEELFLLAPSWKMLHDQPVPLTLLLIGGGGSASPDHSIVPLGIGLQCAGLKIAVPSNAYDAKGLLATAVGDPNPVLFMAHIHTLADRMEVPSERYTIPFGQANVVREGEDVTVVTSSLGVKLAMNAAEAVADEISVEVIDLRTIEPLDIPTVLTSIAKTRRAVVVDQDINRGGLAAELAAVISEACFESLLAPVRRIGRLPVPVPGGLVNDLFIHPDADQIIDAIRATIGSGVGRRAHVG